MKQRIGIALMLGCLVALLAPHTLAVDESTKSASRELAKEGKRDFDKGHFEQASRKFQQAFAATEVPTLALWAARALAKEGKLVAASEFYRKAGQLQKNDLWLGNSQEQAQQHAAQELDKLLPRLVQLTLQIQGAAATEVDITIDGASMPNSLIGVARPTDPGQRVVRAKRGTEVVEEKLVLKEGEQKQLALVFAEKASPAATTVPKPPMTANPSGTQARVTHSDLGPTGTEGSVPNQPKNTTVVPHAIESSRQERAASSNVQNTLGWVTTGVGAAGLIVGTTAGLIVKGRYGDYKPACPSDKCNTSIEQSKLDSYNSWRTISTLGFVVGGIATVAGVTLLLTSPKGNSEASVGLFLSPEWAELRGSF